MKNKEKYAKEILDIVCDDKRVAMLDGKIRECSDIDCELCDFRADGVYCRHLFTIWANSEYVEPPVDWTKVPVDTPILVRDYEGDTWKKRYFARYEDNKVCAWVSGCTSWNEDGTACWTFAKLAEREE